MWKAAQHLGEGLGHSKILQNKVRREMGGWRGKEGEGEGGGEKKENSAKRRDDAIKN